MRKLIYSALAAIGLLLSPSCSDDNEVVNGSGNEALVSFTVNLADGIQTKAISDGTTAKTLHVKVFDKYGNLVEGISEQTYTITDKTAAVTLDLVKGKTYSFLFWAQCETAPYTINDDGSITISYTNAASNEEERDAFVATEKNLTVTGSFTKQVDLHRPFAQLNFLTTADDIKGAVTGNILPGGGQGLKTKVKLSKAATTLHPFTNTVSGETSVVFTEEAVPFTVTPDATNGYTVSAENGNTVRINDQKQTVTDGPGTDYYYLATNYFLVAAGDGTANSGRDTQALVDATLMIEGAEGDGLTVTNVPAKWNYRTNIYGDLLTASNKFNVIIEPGYKDENDNPNEDINSGQPITVTTVDEIATQITNGSRDVTCTADMTSGSTIDIVIPKIFSADNSDNTLALTFTGTIDDGANIKIKAADTGDGSAPKYVTIKNDAGGSWTVDLTTSTVTFTGGSVQSIISSTSSNTLIIAADMIVKNSIKANLGGVLILGQVGSTESQSADPVISIAADNETGNVEIQGTVNGNIVAANNNVNVTIQQGASVTGDVEAKNNIIVNGNVIGDLTISGNDNAFIQIGSGSNVNGTVNSKVEFAPDANTENITVGANTEMNYTIRTADDLFAFAKQVNEERNTYAGKTVVLAADIDLAGRTWTPVGPNADDSNKFKGIFDGQNHTISNLKVQQGAAYHAAGFFGALYGTAKNFTIDGATIESTSAPSNNGRTDNGTAVVAGSIYPSGAIERVTVKNATVNGNRYVGGIAGYVYGSITNCTVESSTITSTPDNLTGSYDNGDKAGGIAGAFWDESTYKISDCRVNDVTIQAYRDFGGIVGFADKQDKVTDCSVSNVKLIQDYSLIPEPKNTVGAIIGRDNSNSNQPYDGDYADQVTKMIAAGTASMLKTVLEAAGSGKGDQTIYITADLDFTGVEWTPVNVQGYTGTGVITINGNNHKITGLKDALFAGGFAGTSGIVINDLTIDGNNVTITDDTEEQGWGYFIKNIDSMPKITLKNCHLKNANITSIGGARVGGLIGWTSGYNNQNDGPVDTHVTITNCSVTNCSIMAKGSVGAIIGHAGSNPATYHTITGCIVTGCTLHSTDDGDWRVGVVVGTANAGKVTISGITESDNTVAQDGKTAPSHSNFYGRFVPNGTGKLTIDNVEITE